MTSKMQPTRRLSLLLALAAAVAFAPGAASQDVSISGTVTDTTGVVLSDVTVEARDVVGVGDVTFSDAYQATCGSGVIPIVDNVPESGLPNTRWDLTVNQWPASNNSGSSGGPAIAAILGIALALCRWGYLVTGQVATLIAQMMGMGDRLTRVEATLDTDRGRRPPHPQAG